MITLLHHPHGPYSSRFRALLDVELKDIEDPSDETQTLFVEAKKLGRKVGCILRSYGGDTYFTYSTENAAQVELLLLPSLTVPPTEFHVTSTNGDL